MSRRLWPKGLVGRLGCGCVSGRRSGVLGGWGRARSGVRAGGGGAPLPRSGEAEGGLLQAEDPWREAQPGRSGCPGPGPQFGPASDGAGPEASGPGRRVLGCGRGGLCRPRGLSLTQWPLPASRPLPDSPSLAQPVLQRRARWGLPWGAGGTRAPTPAPLLPPAPCCDL